MTDTSASMARSLGSLASPVIGLNLLAVTAVFVDTVMCGHLPDRDTVLTGLGFAGQIQFLFLVAMMGLSVGTVALVSRAHGAMDHARVHHVFRQSVQLTVALGVATGALGIALAGPLVTFLGGEAPARAVAESYLQPLFVGQAFAYLGILLAGALRAVGNTRLPLQVALFSTALNVVLDYGLIFGHLGMPALGVAGAAYGTVASQAVGVLALRLAIARGLEPSLHVRPRLDPPDVGLARELLRVGGPAALDVSVLNVALLGIVAMLGAGAEIAVAAHGLGLRVQSLSFVPGVSISQATAALVGQSLGARDPARARRVLGASLALSVGVMSALGGLIFAFAPPLVSLFGVSEGSALMELSVTWMRLLGVGMPLVGLHLAFAGLLQGSGATWTGLGINIAATLGFQLPISAWLGFGLGLGPLGVWAGFPLGYGVRASLGFLAYRRGRWARLGARLPSR